MHLNLEELFSDIYQKNKSNLHFFYHSQSYFTVEWQAKSLTIAVFNIQKQLKQNLIIN